MDQSIKIGIIILVLVLVGFGIYEVTKLKPNSGVGYSPSAVTSAVTSASPAAATPTFLTTGFRTTPGAVVMPRNTWMSQGDAMDSVAQNLQRFTLAGSNDPLSQSKGTLYTSGEGDNGNQVTYVFPNTNITYFLLDNDGFMKMYNSNLELVKTINTVPGGSLEMVNFSLILWSGGPSTQVVWTSSNPSYNGA